MCGKIQNKSYDDHIGYRQKEAPVFAPQLPGADEEGSPAEQPDRLHSQLLHLDGDAEVEVEDVGGRVH